MNITYIHTKPAKNQVNIEVKQNITTIFQIIFILFIWTYDFFISIPMVDTHNNPVWLKIASTFLSLFIFEIFIDSARIKEFKNEKEKNAELISKKRKEIVSSIIIVIISSLTISILLFSK